MPLIVRGRQGEPPAQTKLTRESPFDVWQERITSLLHMKDPGKWTQNFPVTAEDRAQAIKAHAFVVLALSEEMVQLVSPVPLCNDVMRVLKTEGDGTFASSAN